jgi:hypothetical protein
MTRTLRRLRSNNDEQGAALVLVIAFMVVIGAISAALLTSITSGLRGRDVLDSARDRQYAADGAIEQAIARVRTISGTGPAIASCDGPDTPPQINGVNIRVDCTNSPTLTLSGFLQRNVVFTACVVDGSKPCGDGANDSPIIIRALVNFQAIGNGPSLQVQRTWIQSWSVNG